MSHAPARTLPLVDLSHVNAVVEQDVLPGMGTPRESAARNRQYLHSIESNYS